MSAEIVKNSVKGTDREWKSFAPMEEGFAFGRLQEYWVEEVCQLTYTRISPLCATPESIRGVLRRNSDSFWGVFERTSDTHRLVAYHAQLMLNARGHDALKRRAFQFKQPDLAMLCNEGERPEAIYLWGVVAKGKLAKFKPMLAQALSHYAGIPHYATLSTEDGFKAGRVLGLRPVTPSDDQIGGLFIFKAGTAHQPSLQPKKEIRVVTVTTPEQLDQIRAIRAVVFMGEQDCPYAEEFDGNDYCATHILAFVNNEPAGAARIRYFQDFVKLERVAVLERFRGTGLVHKIADFAEEIVRRKGYKLLYGHAQKRLLGFWKERGFEEITPKANFVFSDHEYVELRKFLEPHPERLCLQSDPMILIRPEGQWDEAGVLEKSAERPATNPH
jgi:predicted GNAT family N-acyltransferase